MFKKILVANRGEIAVRIIRACREMDIRAITVFSEADRASLHVLKADEAYLIGPARAVDSYLRIDKIVDAARKSGAEAIHPGYGFLAENPDLPRACDEAGIKLIGPSAAAMEKMGSKTRARELAQSAGVPVVPGTTNGVASPEEAALVAEGIGYPVMLKAAAGGGGKGMRLVREAGEMPSAFRGACSEAQNAFGNSEVYLEKYIEVPRHIEIQILGDEHGNLIHLGERECSVQRRHQKVIEESPSPLVDAALRERMGEAAIRAARAAGYYNAGTVEFLVDVNRQFYFLEMNTRLQVEHPITEAVTGLDLVKLQIGIAAGEKLALRQQDIQFRGTAMECRICAEDPDRSFFPCPGPIQKLEEPSGPGVRNDSGVYAGWTVPVYYDPLISKLITWGATRQETMARMRRALDEYYLEGIRTNLSLFRSILRYPDFLEGRLDTGLIERLLASEHWRARGENASDYPGLDARRAAAVAAVLAEQKRAQGNAPPPNAGDPNRWKLEGRQQRIHQPPARPRKP